MTGRRTALAAIVLILSAAAALAADPPPAQDEQRLICRGGQKSLSSRIRTPRRCHTAERWKEEDEKGGLPISAQITQGQNDGRRTATPQ